MPDPAGLSLLTTTGEQISYTQAVYEHLQETAARDLNDGFAFQIGRPREEPIGAPAGGFRCSIEVRLAGRTFAKFLLDVGLGDAVLDQFEWVEGSSLLNFAGVPAARIAVYPLVQQFAEKIHVYTFPWQDRVNTRVKDLVDLVLLVHSGQLDPERVRRALRATFETRRTHPLPAQLPEPPADWAESYAALAQELGLPALALQEAYTYLNDCWQQWGLGQASETDPRRV